jgi:RND family efflux transporter MFP subunit
MSMNSCAGLTLAAIAMPASLAAAGPSPAQVSCVVLPNQHLNVASSVPGIIRAVSVQRGDFVRAGQPLMRVASDMESAQLKLAATKADMLRRKLARNAEAIQKHLISDQERDQLESDARLAQQEYEVARRAVAQKTTVSPISGIVANRKAEPGQYAGTDPVFELVSLNPLRVELVFRVGAYGTIKRGQTVAIDLGPPVNGTRRGTVAIVDRVIDARSGTFGVRVNLPNADLKIPSGVACKAAL